MAERPKFRRKKRMQVEEISDVLPQRLPQTQTDSDPIAPLETREERLARRAAKASDEQRLAKEALRRGVEARAEARRRAEQEDMAQAAAQRAAAARLAQRQQADAEARRTAEAQAATKAQEDQDRAKAAAAAREAKAYDQLVKEQEHKAKTLAAERKARIAEASRKAAQQRAEAKRRAEEEETIRAEKSKRAEAEAKAKAEARAQEAREKAEALAHAKAEEDARIEAEEQARTEAEAEAEERAAEKLRRKAQRRAEEAERREQVDMAARPERKAPTPEEPLTLTNPVMPVAEQAAELTAPAPVPEPAAEAMSAPPQTLAQTWAGMSEFTLDERHLERNRIITAGRNDPAHAAFDVLRTRLLQALAERGWSRVAITSATKGCGKTFTAANLAISLARQENCATLLLDMDMRHPSLHKVFGVQSPGSIGDMLRGRVSATDHLIRPAPNNIHAGRNIAFGFNDVAEDYASELLQDPVTKHALQQMQDTLKPGVVLYDMPPALSSDDVIAFRAHFDAVLLVVGGGLTTQAEIKEVERRLGEQTPLLGMVLNKAEGVSSKTYSY